MIFSTISCLHLYSNDITIRHSSLNVKGRVFVCGSPGGHHSGWLWKQQTVRGNPGQLRPKGKQHVLLCECHGGNTDASQRHRGDVRSGGVLNGLRCAGTHLRLFKRKNSRLIIVSFQVLMHGAHGSKKWMLENSGKQTFTVRRGTNSFTSCLNNTTTRQWTVYAMNISPHWKRSDTNWSKQTNKPVGNSGDFAETCGSHWPWDVSEKKRPNYDIC